MTTSEKWPRIQWRSDPCRAVLIYENGREEPTAWAPQKGSQKAFLASNVFETLYEGTRGPGKTDALLMDFAQFCGVGWGADWRGVLFRQTHPELQDVIDKSKKWFPLTHPSATYNEAKSFWEWGTGEKLFFRQFKKTSDYWSFHGHAYPWQGWEELTTWPSSDCYKSMFACARSTRTGMPIRIRSTTNPYGPGHNWVKARWRLPLSPRDVVGKVISNSRDRDGELEPARVAVHGHILENRIMMEADPGYLGRIRAAARNKSEQMAWLHGSWDVVAGGMFDDVWDPTVHVLPNIPLDKIPRGWIIDRSYDHGQSKPFSVGWWAESNGEPFVYEGIRYGAIPGDVIRIAEWYGWNGEPNVGVRLSPRTIAQGIKEREEDWGIRARVRAGPADSSIFDEHEPTKSTAGDMAALGVKWLHADKGPGSRKQGWLQIRTLLGASAARPREHPGLYVLDRCEQFRRTVPVLSRSDKDVDDVNTESEDHIGDETRYRLRRKRTEASSGDW